MTKYQLLLSQSRRQKKMRNRLIQKYGNEIIDDFAKARSTYDFKLNDIAIKYGFTRERARQMFLKLYQKPYGFYQNLLCNERIRGKTFSRLTAMDKIGNDSWLCICDCGNTIITRNWNLLRGSTRSCGCIAKIHGMSKTKAHRRWANMLSRCRCETHPEYKYYGGRGIQVCERWLKFKNFYEDMGECPEGLTIERIDNDGNYEASNCKWATYKEQANNRRPRPIELFEFHEEKLTIYQWAKKMGLNYGTLAYRLNHHWCIKEALLEPVAYYHRTKRLLT